MPISDTEKLGLISDIIIFWTRYISLQHSSSAGFTVAYLCRGIIENNPYPEIESRKKFFQKMKTCEPALYQRIEAYLKQSYLERINPPKAKAQKND